MKDPEVFILLTGDSSVGNFLTRKHSKNNMTGDISDRHMLFSGQKSSKKFIQELVGR